MDSDMAVSLEHPQADEHFCTEEGCGKSFPTKQGLSMHVARSHKKDEVDADEAFERIGAATEALFPDGIPATRIIELADLQKQMLKVVTR